MARCSRCGRFFRTLPDEEQDHACPRCGYEPAPEATRQIDYHGNVVFYLRLFASYASSNQWDDEGEVCLQDVLLEAAERIELLEASD